MGKNSLGKFWEWLYWMHPEFVFWDFITLTGLNTISNQPPLPGGSVGPELHFVVSLSHFPAPILKLSQGPPISSHLISITETLLSVRKCQRFLKFFARNWGRRSDCSLLRYRPRNKALRSCFLNIIPYWQEPGLLGEMAGFRFGDGK